MKEIAIKENHLYSKAYAKGKKFVGRYVAVYVLKDYRAKEIMKANPEKKYVNRVGLSVSKKLGGAVERNRAKRLMRAAYAEVKKNGGLRCGYLVVISARTMLLEVKSGDVARELEFAFGKLGMINEPEKSV